MELPHLILAIHFSLPSLRKVLSSKVIILNTIYISVNKGWTFFQVITSETISR